MNLRDAIALFCKGNAYKAQALRCIRDDKLFYEKGYECFKDFVEGRLGIAESYAYKLIRYVDYLDWIGLDIWTAEALPAEGSVRPLISHSAKRPDLAERVYAKAVELAGEPTRITSDIARRAIAETERELDVPTLGNDTGKQRRKKSDLKTVADKVEPSIKGEITDAYEIPENTAQAEISAYVEDNENLTAEDLTRFVQAEIKRVGFIMQWLDEYRNGLERTLAELAQPAA